MSSSGLTFQLTTRAKGKARMVTPVGAEGAPALLAERIDSMEDHADLVLKSVDDLIRIS